MPWSGLTRGLAWGAWVLRVGEPMVEADWLAPYALDVRVTLGVQGRGRGDPTYRVDEGGAIWRTSLTPDGPGTIRVLPRTPVATTGGVASVTPTSSAAS